MSASTVRESSERSLGSASATAPPRCGFLDKLLALKHQEAALLFASVDDEGTGVIAASHLRPLLVAVFPPPRREGEDAASTGPSHLLVDRSLVESVYKGLLGPANVRTVFESVTRRPLRLARAATAAVTECVFTLNELHGIMDSLFYADLREGRSPFGRAGASLLRRDASSPSLPQRPATVTFTDSAPAPLDEPTARVVVPVLSFPRESKEFDDDSIPSTGRESSYDDHSSATSHAATVGIATTASVGALVLLPANGPLPPCAPGTLSAATPGPCLVPIRQLALMLGSLERAFPVTDGSVAADPPPFASRSWTREEWRACVSAISPSAPSSPQASQFDAFLQIALSRSY